MGGFVGNLPLYFSLMSKSFHFAFCIKRKALGLNFNVSYVFQPTQQQCKVVAVDQGEGT